MIIEKAVFGSLFFTVIVQGLRQLLPNIIAYPWQVLVCSIVPENYRDHRWFNDKNSIFYFSSEHVKIHKLPLTSQSNLRSIVLLFGLCFWLLSQFNAEDIVEGWSSLTTLVVVATFIALPVKVAYEGLEKFNPDVVLRVTFSSISLLLSFRLVLFLD
jgi:hypothetical protein